MADAAGKLTIRDLPPEIFHNILDQLGCHDRDAIAVCTLVCRDWLEISREHLFSEIHVPRGLDESFEDLAIFLETHPILAGYVRILSLEALLFSIPPNHGLMPLIDAGLICRLARAVPHIHELRLRQLNIAPSPVELNTTHKIVVEHMEYEKSFSSIATTFALLDAFHIEHLDFDPLFEDEECAETDVSVRDKTLDVVSLCVNPFTMYPLLAFNALQQVVPPNMLKSFRYPSPLIHPVKLPVATFLTDVGQNIVDLDICPTAKDDYLVLPKLPSLQVFRYHPGVPLLAPAADLPSQQALVVPFRDSWLPHLPSDLEELILYIKYSDTDSAADLTPGATTMPLWGLDAPIARFRRLKKLTICFPDVPGCVTVERADRRGVLRDHACCSTRRFLMGTYAGQREYRAGTCTAWREYGVGAPSAGEGLDSHSRSLGRTAVYSVSTDRIYLVYTTDLHREREPREPPPHHLLALTPPRTHGSIPARTARVHSYQARSRRRLYSFRVAAHRSTSRETPAGTWPAGAVQIAA